MTRSRSAQNSSSTITVAPPIRNERGDSTAELTAVLGDRARGRGTRLRPRARRGPVLHATRSSALFQLDQRRPTNHHFAGARRHALHPSIARGSDQVLHLHGFEHHQWLTLL